MLIVDEPTVGLDPEERIHFRTLLAHIGADRTVLLSTHIVDDVAQTCGRLALLARGRVCFTGTVTDLTTAAFGHVWTVTAPPGPPPTGSWTIVAALQHADGVTYRIVGHPSADLSALPAEPTLEDGYVRLMQTQSSPPAASRRARAGTDSDVPAPFLPGSADADVVADRRLAGVYERGRAYLGELGIGKSVLVNRIAADAAACGHWVAGRVRLVRGGDPVGLVATALRQMVAERELDARIGQRSEKLIERIEEIRLPAGLGGIRTRPSDARQYRHLVLTELLVQLGTLARETRSHDLPDGRLVLLRIDQA